MRAFFGRLVAMVREACCLRHDVVSYGNPFTFGQEKDSYLKTRCAKCGATGLDPVRLARKVD